LRVGAAQALFLLWVQDLSARDPYFILPAIMAAAMFGQFKAQSRPARSRAGQGICVHAARDVGDDGVPAAIEVLVSKER
jgi:hypothetical protein